MAIEVTRKDDSGPISGNLILHNIDHDLIWEKIARDKRRVYVTYARQPIEKRYAMAF